MRSPPPSLVEIFWGLTLLKWWNRLDWFWNVCCWNDLHLFQRVLFSGMQEIRKHSFHLEMLTNVVLVNTVHCGGDADFVYILTCLEKTVHIGIQ